MNPQKVRIAFFGSRSSGKTSLLSSYYGHMQRPTWEAERRYRLSTAVSDGNVLLKNFYGMQDGKFPEATLGRATPYVFSMWITGCREPAFDIEWLDYPGGWWERVPEDAAGRAARDECLKSLAQSHVGFLIVDAFHYKRDGRAYLRALLSQFNNVVRDFKQAAGAAAGTGVPDWLIILTKADLMPPTYTAEQFAKECLHAAEQINGLAATLNSPRFGHRYLLVFDHA